MCAIMQFGERRMYPRMKLILVFLIGCLMQSIDSRNTIAFEVNVTINREDSYLHECSVSDADCKRYIDELLCPTLTFPLPNDYNDTELPECNATLLHNDTSTNASDWNIQMQLPSWVSDRLTVNLTCPTFANTYNYSLGKRLTPYFMPKLLSFKPAPIPFDPTKATDADYKISGQLYYNKTAIKASEWKDPGAENLLDELRIITVKHEMGRSLYAYPQMKLSNLTKIEKGDDVFVSFIMKLPDDYVITLGIDPNCDVAAILQFSLMYDTHRDWYHLGPDVTVKLATSDDETTETMTTSNMENVESITNANGATANTVTDNGVTGASNNGVTGASNNGVTASPTTSTTDSGRITRPAVNTLALSMVISHVLAII